MRIGCLAVHYGKEYLAWAIRGLDHACDEIHVFYTAQPSFGFEEASAKNPDTRDQLMFEANRFSKKVHWHDVVAFNEIQHRELMINEARLRGAKLMAICDADEVWSPVALKDTLDAVEASNSAGRWLARFANFWRSWQWMVHDGFRPVRILDLRHPLDVDAYLDEIMQPQPIFHFGYAQTLETMRYKFTCHGHKAEFKPGWFEQKFIGWDPHSNNFDLHPCVNDFWIATPTPIDTLNMLDLLMPEHPHHSLGVIS